MNKRFLLIIPLIAVAGILASLAVITIQEKPFEPQIALLFPTSGDFSTHGNENLVAAKLAVDDFNDYLRENENSWRLGVWRADSQTSPQTSLQAVKDLHSEGVKIIIGPETSAELAMIKPYADANGMLIISPTSTAPSLAITDDNIFRLSPDDTNQANAISQMLEENHIRAISLLTRDDVWGMELSQKIKEYYADHDHNHKFLEVTYDPEDPDYLRNTEMLSYTITSHMAEFQPEQIAVIVLGFGESSEFLKYAGDYENLDDVRWFGTDSNANEKKITSDPAALDFANRVEFSAVQFTSSPSDFRDSLESEITELNGSPPSNYAYSSYDAVMVIAKSIEKTNSDDPKIIGSALRDVAQNYNGALGDIILNDAGDLDSADYAVWGIVDDKWKVIDIIEN